METAEFGMPAKFAFPAERNFPEVKILDPEVETVAIGEMIELGEEINRPIAEKHAGHYLRSRGLKGQRYIQRDEFPGRTGGIQKDHLRSGGIGAL